MKKEKENRKNLRLRNIVRYRRMHFHFNNNRLCGLYVLDSMLITFDTSHLEISLLNAEAVLNTTWVVIIVDNKSKKRKEKKKNLRILLEINFIFHNNRYKYLCWLYVQ